MFSSKVWVIFRKEMREHFRKPRSFLSLSLVPLFAVALYLYMITESLRYGEQMQFEILKQLIDTFLLYYVIGILLIEQYILMHEIIVKEKSTRTIETILASPISPSALVQGKVLSLYLPSLLITLPIGLGYVGIANWIATKNPLFYLPEAMIWGHYFLIVPLLCFLIGEIVSIVALISNSKAANIMMFLLAFGIFFMPSFFFKNLPTPSKVITGYVITIAILFLIRKKLLSLLQKERIILSS